MSVTVIEDNSDKVAEELRVRINKALEICGLTAENYAKKLCTVDTGLLRNSITHALSGEPAAISTYSADKAKGNKQFRLANIPAPRRKKAILQRWQFI